MESQPKIPANKADILGSLYVTYRLDWEVACECFFQVSEVAQIRVEKKSSYCIYTF